MSSDMRDERVHFLRTKTKAYNTLLGYHPTILFATYCKTPTNWGTMCKWCTYCKILMDCFYCSVIDQTTELKQEGSEGSEESKGGLDRCSVRGD